MNKYKIKSGIKYIIFTALVIYFFSVIFYLFIFPNKTIEQIIFLCGTACLVVWIYILEREKSILRVELLKRLRADLLLKSECAKAGVANKYKEEKEEDLLVYILSLLGYKKEPLKTVENVNDLLKYVT
ncbi:MAG TPA: hypothetical protein ENO17_01695 [Candidatus Atribacteria bacterium]|nr:hypothetical protein [Candidatus Atribacteria bacterium]